MTGVAARQMAVSVRRFLRLLRPFVPLLFPSSSGRLPLVVLFPLDAKDRLSQILLALSLSPSNIPPGFSFDTINFA
jgi:hypothetical protein